MTSIPEVEELFAKVVTQSDAVQKLKSGKASKENVDVAITVQCW